MAHNLDVVSIGAATADIFITSRSFTLQGDHLILPNSSKNEISHQLVCSGGGATNSSVAFSRLGLHSACVSLVGPDPISTYVLNDLDHDHVTKYIARDNHDNTDFSVILISPDGGRIVLVNRGTTRLESRHIPWTKIKKTSWLYLTSLEGNLNLLEKIIGFATENKIHVSLNPGSRELNQKKLLLPLLAHVDFLLLNKTESESLTGTTIDKASYWPKLISTGAKIVAVTHGRDGAYITDGKTNLFSPIINTKPVDETGAGDSFGSTFIAGQIHHLSLEQSLSWAIHNSASVVSQFGAKPGLLRLKDLEK